MANGNGGGADHNTDLEDLKRDLWYARYGDPRFGHEDFTPFPSLIARADAIGDPYWMFQTRLEAASAGMWSARLTDVLTLVVWLLRDLDAKGPALQLEEYDLRQLHVTLVDLIQSVADLPQLSFAQIRSLLDNWARRAQADGFYSPTVVATVSAQLAYLAGDGDRATALLEDAGELDAPVGTCDSGVRAVVASIYSALGRDQEVIDLVEGDLVDNGERCGFFPAETYHPLLLPYARQGRRDDVRQAVRAVDSIYGALPSERGRAADAVTALLLIDDLAAAHELVVRHLDDLSHAFTPMVELQQSAAFAATLFSLAAVDPDILIPQRTSQAEPVRMRPVAQLADELADRARELAAQFDARNRSTVISEHFEHVVALRAAGYPAADVTPVSRRDAAGLLSGMFAFQQTSMRRAKECADLLRPRISELSEVDAARAEQSLSWELRTEDPEAAVTALQAAANRAAEVGRPHWAMQSRLLADALSVGLGHKDPVVLEDFAGPDPSWAPERQANVWNVYAMVCGASDEAALAALDRGLALLSDPDSAVAAGEPSASGAGSSPAADAWMLASTMHRARANVRAQQGMGFEIDADASVAAARLALAAAQRADQRMEAQAALVDALRLAAADQQQRDLAGALPLLDEAETQARYVQRAEVLMHRHEVRMALGDLPGAITDAEHARAVLTVEGLDHPADGVALDVAGAMLDRGDDPRDVLDIAAPATDRLLARGDEVSADRGRRVMASAQARAGLHAEAVNSITTVIEALPPETDAGDRARLVRFRADENNAADFDAAAGTDYLSAAALFAENGELLEAVDAQRNAGLASFYTGDIPAAEQRLARAGQMLAALPEDSDAAVSRVQVDLAIAEVRRESDVDGARVLVNAAGQTARANGWIPLVVVACRIAARIEHEQGNTELALAHMDEAISHAPDDENLCGMRAYIAESD